MWADSFTVEVGGTLVDVRASSHGAFEALRAALADCTVLPTAAARAHFSLHLAADRSEVHRLYHGACIVTRSVDPARVARALFAHLAAGLPSPAGITKLYGRAVVTEPGRCVLLPHAVDAELQAFDARLRHAGFIVSDVPVLGFDLASCEVLLPNDSEHAEAVARATKGAPARRVEESPAAGRYKVDQWWFVHYFDQPGRLSRATATRRAAQVLDPGRDLDAPFLEALATCFDHIEARSAELAGADLLEVLTRSDAR